VAYTRGEALHTKPNWMSEKMGDNGKSATRKAHSTRSRSVGERLRLGLRGSSLGGSRDEDKVGGGVEKTSGGRDD
jgi:hypothetical protein